MATQTLTSNQPDGYDLDGDYSELVIDSGVTVGSSGSFLGVYSGYVAAIINYGTILSSSGHIAVQLNVGGAVTNGSATNTTALIKGGEGVAAGAATITNFGTIEGDSETGVYLGGGGMVINGTAADSTALILSTIDDAILANGPDAETVINFGTISGIEGSVSFGSASSRLIVENKADFLGNVTGGGGTLELAGGADTITSLINGVMTGAASASISGFGTFIVDAGAGLTLSGVTDLNTDETLTVKGTLANHGTLSGPATTGYAVVLSGGSLTNGSATDTTALITGDRSGVYAVAYTTVAIANFGTIVASGAGSSVGVNLEGDASLTNGSATDATALLKGGYGVYALGSATVINFGTIDGVGGISVHFHDAADRLVVESGSTFIGAARGGGGTLAFDDGAGTIAGLGGSGVFSVGAAGSFSGFGTYDLYGGASWALSGGGTIASGKALDIGASSTATLESGTLASSGDIAMSAGGVLAGYAGATLVNNGTITGGGAIYGTMAVTNAAGGLIDDNAGAMQINNQYGDGLNNEGLIESAAGATLSLKGVLLDGNGTTEAFGTIKLIGDNISSSSLNVELGGVLLVTSSGDNFGSALDISNAGSIRINSGGNLFTGANISGAGSVAIDGASGADAVITARGDVTFSGGGTVSLNADGFIYGSASDGLTNADTITGGGTISSQMTITNAAGGVIDGDAGDMLIDNQAGSGLNNDGLIESAVGDSLTLANALMSGTGATEAFGTIKLDGDNIESGSLSVESGGLLQVTSSGSNIGPGVDVSNAGSIKVSGGGNLYISSDISGAGSMALDGASGADADLGMRGDVTLSGGGTVSMNAEGVIFGYGISFTNADTITGGGAIFGSMTVTNSGVIDDDAGAMLINNQNGGGLINTGTLESTATGILSLKDVTVTGAGSIIDDHQLKLATAAINGGTITIGSSALFEVISGTSSLGSAVTMTNDKTLEVITGGVLTIAGLVANNGIMETVGTGDLTLSGAVAGTGSDRLTGSGNLTIDGTTNQGVAFASTATGDLVLGSSSTFTGTISGLSGSGANAIDLRGVAYNASDTAVFSGKTGTLTLYSSSDAVLATLKLKGNYNGSTFVLSNDSAGGTLINDPPASGPMAQAMAGFGAATSSGGQATPSTAAPQSLPLAVRS